MSYVSMYAFSPMLQRLRKKKAVRGKERKREKGKDGKKRNKKKINNY